MPWWRTSERAAAWAIIARELRVEARNQSNYLLRLLGAAGLTVLFSSLMSGQPVVSASLSTQLFASVHSLILAGIWVVGPLLTADSLSRERREGTLGLLFSTTMTARSIVLGKGFVHMVRALTLWFAALPIMIVPFLLGGVTWLDVVSALGLEACAILLALPAGLVASSLTRGSFPTILLAQLISFSLAMLFHLGLGRLIVMYIVSLAPGGTLNFALRNLLECSLTFSLGIGGEGGWSRIFRSIAPGADRIWLSLLAEMVLLSALGFVLLLSLASWRTEKTWREQPPSARQMKRRKVWLTPRFWLAEFRQRKARHLDRNPLAWLQQYSAGRRASKLGWYCLILSANSILILSPEPWMYFGVVEIWLAILLSLHMTVVAAWSFRRELESGVLELLLVTPVTVTEIVYRQLCGFWSKFFGPLVLFLVMYKWIIYRDIGNETPFHMGSFVALNFVTAPIIGLCLATRFWNFAAVFGIIGFFTLGLPLLGPELGAGLIDRLTSLELPWFFSVHAWPPEHSPDLGGLTRLGQIAMAMLAISLLHRNLSQRTFALGRSIT
jgi:ABC-type transport system involved in cytochrome c biogenesis permease component